MATKKATKKTTATKPKATTRKKRLTAKQRADLVAATPTGWVDEMRRTLFALATRLRDAAESGKMTPLEMIGATRALTDAINDRDAILATDEDGAP